MGQWTTIPGMRVGKFMLAFEDIEHSTIALPEGLPDCKAFHRWNDLSWLCLPVLVLVAWPLSIRIDVDAHAITADDRVRGIEGPHHRNCIIVTL